MSDEQRKDSEPEVEGHYRKVGASDEPVEEAEDEETEVEAHLKYPNVRMD